MLAWWLCLPAAAAGPRRLAAAMTAAPSPLPSAAPPVQRCMSLAGSTGVGALLSELKETGQLQPIADGDAAME